MGNQVAIFGDTERQDPSSNAKLIIHKPHRYTKYQFERNMDILDDRIKPQTILKYKFEYLNMNMRVTVPSDCIINGQPSTISIPDSIHQLQRGYLKLLNDEHISRRKIQIKETQVILDKILPVELSSLVMVFAYGHRNLFKKRYDMWLQPNVVNMRLKSKHRSVKSTCASFYEPIIIM